MSQSASDQPALPPTVRRLQWWFAIPIVFTVSGVAFLIVPSVRSWVGKGGTWIAVVYPLVGFVPLFVAIIGIAIGLRRISVWADIGAVVICLVSLTIGLAKFTFGTSDTWLSVRHDRVAGLVALPVTVAVFFLIPAAVFRLLSVRALLREVFSAGANVQPLHPDGAGGLAPLGKLSMSLNLVVFVEGLIAAGAVISNIHLHHHDKWSIDNIAVMTGYFVGATAVFFVPLLAARSPMLAARKDFLGLISTRFDMLNDEIRSTLRDPPARPSKEQLAFLSDLRDLHLTVSKMPVYPFNIQILLYFGTSIVVPVIINFLGAWLSGLLQ